MKNNHILLVEDNPDDIALTQRAFVFARRSQDDHRHKFGARVGAQAAQDFEAGNFRQLQVQQHDGGRFPRFPAGIGARAKQIIKGQDAVADHHHRVAQIAFAQDLVNGYALGCNSYVRKPIDFNRFADAIRQLGLYWMVLNETGPVRSQ